MIKYIKQLYDLIGNYNHSRFLPTHWLTLLCSEKFRKLLHKCKNPEKQMKYNKVEQQEHTTRRTA